ncbi:MAG: phage tail tape measure protein [Anaerolineae bacterium]|nr:phage tail tape measure protein [Anaerolineae bacterium]
MAQYVEIEFVGRDEVSNVARRVKQSIFALDAGATRLANVFNTVLSGAVGGLTFALTNLATQALGAAVGAVASAVNSFADFEAAQLRLQAISGATGEQLNRMRELAIELGKSTRFSASESLQAMIALAQGGVTTEQILSGATQAALDLAAAGGVDLARAAEIVAKQLAVWGDTGLDAARAATLIAAAANASTTDVHELGYGFAALGSVAKSTGLSFEETAIALAAVVPAAGSAQDAGTSLKVALQRLAAPTREARELMQQLGISAFDSQGRFVGLEALAGQLNAALRGMSDAQRAATLEILGGADAARALGQLADLGAEGIQKLREQMSGLGSVSEQSRKMNKGLAFAMDELNAKLETLGLAIGERVAPVLIELIGIIGDVIEAVTDLVQSIRTESVVSAVASIKGAFASARDTAASAFADISRHASSVLNSLRPIAEAIASALRGSFEALHSFIFGALRVWKQSVEFAFEAVRKLIDLLGRLPSPFGINLNLPAAPALAPSLAASGVNSAAAETMDHSASRFDAAVARFERVVQQATQPARQAQPTIADLRLLRQAR